MKLKDREKIDLPSGHSFRMLRWSRNLQEVESVLAPDRAERVVGAGTQWHYHVEMELTLFMRGEGMRFVGDHIGLFGAGDLVLLGEKLPHYWHALGPSSGLSAQWSFPHGHPFWAFPEMLSFAGLFQKAGCGIRYTGPTAGCISEGLRELVCVSGADRLGLLIRLLALMERAPASDWQTLSSRSFALSTESAHQRMMGDVVRFLIANFREKICMDDVLCFTKMSKATFSRQFKKHAGKSFIDFLSQVRLEAACRQLVETDRSVLEIAFSSGFGNISFFNRLFFRTFQCNPTQYRKRSIDSSSHQIAEL